MAIYAGETRLSGNISSLQVTSEIDKHNVSGEAHQDIRDAIPTDIIVSAVIGETAVPKVGTQLKLPIYPVSLPASDVKAWAKAETKPTYTADEVAADAKGSADVALDAAKTYTNTEVSKKANKAVSSTATLTVAGWIGSAKPYSQQISVSGLTPTSGGSYGLNESATNTAQREAARKAMIYGIQGNETMTFYADGEKPIVDLSIYMEVVN